MPQSCRESPIRSLSRSTSDAPLTGLRSLGMIRRFQRCLAAQRPGIPHLLRAPCVLERLRFCSSCGCVEGQWLLQASSATAQLRARVNFSELDPLAIVALRRLEASVRELLAISHSPRALRWHFVVPAGPAVRELSVGFAPAGPSDGQQLPA